MWNGIQFAFLNENFEFSQNQICFKCKWLINADKIRIESR